MKQAICLLAYKDMNYVHKFIDQFESHPDIEFYVHWHNHSDEECNELKSYSESIKYVCNQFDTRTFTRNLVDAEMHLYQKAIENPETGMFHLLSESNYLICDADYFVSYFNENSDCNFLSFVDNDPILNIANTFIFLRKYCGHKASQWKSLNVNTMHKLLNNLDMVNELIFLNSKSRRGLRGALDEFIVPTILKEKCNIDTNLKHNLCYVNWTNCFMHPNTLTYSLYENPDYCINDDDILQNLSMRKIDIMDESCRTLLDEIKSKFKIKHNLV